MTGHERGPSVAEVSEGNPKLLWAVGPVTVVTWQRDVGYSNNGEFMS